MTTQPQHTNSIADQLSDAEQAGTSAQATRQAKAIVWAWIVSTGPFSLSEFMRRHVFRAARKIAKQNAREQSRHAQK